MSNEIREALKKLCLALDNFAYQNSAAAPVAAKELRQTAIDLYELLDKEGE